ncbi:MAG: hypothetical protein K1V86_03045 [Duncaniella sp.]|jgi:hypothetical protein
MIMDIDELKRQWNAVDIPDSGVRAVEREVTSGRGAVTLRDRLMRISHRRALVCLAGALCMIPLVPDHTSMAVKVIIFFIVMGVMHLVQMRNLRALDLSGTTVTEALRGVLRIETLRTVRRVTGIVMGVPLILYIIFTTTSSYGTLMLPVCIAGMLAGCVVALLVNRRASRLLREIKKELGEDFSAS